MSWLDEQRNTLAEIFAAREPLGSRYEKLYASFWEDGLVPRRILELTRLRIAAIHDARVEWDIRDAKVTLDDDDLDALRRADFSGFSEAEQAALVIAEKMPWQHHSIRDAEVSRLREVLGTPASISLMTALAFFDMTARMKIVLGVVPGDTVPDQEGPRR